MNNPGIVISEITNGKYLSLFKDIYVDADKVDNNKSRYINAINRFCSIFGDKEIAIFSAPGRSEVCGNHTDHQNGHVLATAINLDAIAVVAPNNNMVVKLVSDDSDMVIIDLNDVMKRNDEINTTAALIRGVAAGLKQKGYELGGFEAFVTSDVLIGAGMSSSASFESLIGAIFSGLYNKRACAGKISSVDIARVGQYAENEYFGKPCGLMDQIACSVGGLVYIDFNDANNLIIEKVPCDLEAYQYSLCIVDTKGSHADLTDDYASIPKEMVEVANYYEKDVLRDVNPEEFFASIKNIRSRLSDRAVLRAMHFFTEQQRVKQAVNALKQNNFNEFLSVISKSGDSSMKLLQNIYSPKDVNTQNVNIALAMSEHILQEHGVCRIHGGGFAGTIQVFVENEFVNEYKTKIEAILGEGTCHILKIRQYGQIQVI